MSLALLILAQVAPVAAIAPPPCRVLLVDKQAGEPIFADEVAAAECPAKVPMSMLGFDRRHRLVLARSALAAGAPLGRAYVPVRPAVVAGQAVRLTVTIGRATVSREVTALQSADRGQRYFVKAANGDVFAAPAMAAGAAARRNPQ